MVRSSYSIIPPARALRRSWFHANVTPVTVCSLVWCHDRNVYPTGYIADWHFDATCCCSQDPSSQNKSGVHFLFLSVQPISVVDVVDYCARLLFEGSYWIWPKPWVQNGMYFYTLPYVYTVHTRLTVYWQFCINPVRRTLFKYSVCYYIFIVMFSPCASVFSCIFMEDFTTSWNVLHKRSLLSSFSKWRHTPVCRWRPHLSEFAWTWETRGLVLE